MIKPNEFIKVFKLTLVISDVSKFIVDSNETVFTYWYAPVLEDPGHPPSAQPGFTVIFLDSLNDSIPGSELIVKANNTPFTFQLCGVVKWKDWSSVSVNLSNYIGQKVIARFTTNDCGYGGHFGYAYIDASSTFGIGIYESVINEQLLISPNPSEGDFLLQLPALLGDFIISITDVKGNLIYKSNWRYIDGNLNINLKGYPSGIYFLKAISVEGRTYSSKIVKVGE